jgi:dipeptidyl aminopeptidase/acylaminoacyl peptidase
VIVIKPSTVALFVGSLVLAGATDSLLAQAEPLAQRPTLAAQTAGVISFATPDGLFWVHPEGGDRQVLIQDPDILVDGLAWSADGDQLAVSHNQSRVSFVDVVSGALTPVFVSQCPRPPAIHLQWQRPPQTLGIKQRCDQPAISPQGQIDLWLADPNDPEKGGIEVALPVALESDLYLSPDGTQVAYAANRHLYIAPVDGGAPRRVTQMAGTYGAAGSPLAWSPDGTQLAVYEGSYPFQTIHLVRVDGSEQRSLISEPDFQIYRSRLLWSPDGRYLAFYRPFNPPFSNQEVVALLEVATGTLESLTGPGFFSALNWSPDGQQLAFAFGEDIEQQGMFVLDLPSRDYTSLTAESYQMVLDSQWSPQGDWIAFTATPLGDELGTQVLHAVRPDGTDLNPLTSPDDYVYPFTWIPTP